MLKEDKKQIFIQFVEEVIEIALENIENDHTLLTPEEQLLDALEEFKQNIKNFFDKKENK